MNRFQEAEQLSTTVREEIPRVAIRWLAAVRTPLEVLTTAALDPATSDTDFLALVEKFSAEIPGLMETMDHDALGELMASGMGAAMGNGMAGRIKSPEARMKEEKSKKAAMPGETEVWVAGNKNHDRKGSFARKASHEWPAASEQEAGILARLTGRNFKPGARIHATEDGVRHAERGHGHQLSGKDWKQLKGRMFDQHTQRGMTRTANNEEAASFKFQRGSDRMEAIFTIHFRHKQAPGELRLKTYAQRG